MAARPPARSKSIARPNWLSRGVSRSATPATPLGPGTAGTAGCPINAPVRRTAFSRTRPGCPPAAAAGAVGAGGVTLVGGTACSLAKPLPRAPGGGLRSGAGAGATAPGRTPVAGSRPRWIRCVLRTHSGAAVPARPRGAGTGADTTGGALLLNTSPSCAKSSASVGLATAGGGTGTAGMAFAVGFAAPDTAPTPRRNKFIRPLLAVLICMSPSIAPNA